MSINWAGVCSLSFSATTSSNISNSSGTSPQTTPLLMIFALWIEWPRSKREREREGESAIEWKMVLSEWMDAELEHRRCLRALIQLWLSPVQIELSCFNGSSGKWPLRRSHLSLLFFAVAAHLEISEKKCVRGVWFKFTLLLQCCWAAAAVSTF